MIPKLIKPLVARLGDYHLRKGKEYSFRCPKCKDHRKRLDVNPRKMQFNCYHCKWGGKFWDLYIFLKIEFKPSDFEIGLKETAKGLSPTQQEIKIPERQSIGSPAAVNFTQSRGISVRTCVEKEWGVGVGPMLSRLIIPILENGKTVCWAARSIFPHVRPKEIYPDASISNVSHFVYGLDDLEGGEGIIIVESIFDREVVKAKGFMVVSILGSNLSDIQCGKILSKNPRVIYLMFDGDDAGRKGTKVAVTKLRARAPWTMRVRAVDLPEGKDPDELSLAELNNLIANAREVI